MKKLQEFTRRDFFVLVKRLNETADRISEIERLKKTLNEHEEAHKEAGGGSGRGEASTS